jgi:hypothetical protein
MTPRPFHCGNIAGVSHCNLPLERRGCILGGLNLQQQDAHTCQYQSDAKPWEVFSIPLGKSGTPLHTVASTGWLLHPRNTAQTLGYLHYRLNVACATYMLITQEYPYAPHNDTRITVRPFPNHTSANNQSTHYPLTSIYALSIPFAQSVRTLLPAR